MLQVTPKFDQAEGRTTERVGKAVTVELPAYVVPLWSKRGYYRFYFQVPGWARKKGCPVRSAPLGNDLTVALAKASKYLAAFRAWQSASNTVYVETSPSPYTIRWLISEYMGHRRFKDEISDNTRKSYIKALRALQRHVFTGGPHAGTCLGNMPCGAVDETVVDRLIDELLIEVVVEDGVERTIKRRHRTREVVTTAATMWNVCGLKLGRRRLGENPFLGHRVSRGDSPILAATVDELCAVVLCADNLGHGPVGTLCMTAFELVWRPEHILTHFMVEHYRPASHPDHIYIRDEKNKVRKWRPLFDRNGRCLYPRLVERLDDLKGTRLEGNMFEREADVSSGAGGKEARSDTVVRWYQRKLKDIVRAAGHPDLTVATFRHGGLTELGEAGLTEEQIMCLSLHKDAGVLRRYLKHTSRGQRISQRLRLEFRDGADGSGPGASFLGSTSDVLQAEPHPAAADRENEDQLSLAF